MNAARKSTARWWVVPVVLVMGTELALAQQINDPRNQRRVDTNALERQFAGQFTKLVNPNEIDAKVRNSVGSAISEDKIRQNVLDSVNQFVSPQKIEADVQTAVGSALDEAFSDLSNLNLSN
jgi:hypothetical protein